RPQLTAVGGSFGGFSERTGRCWVGFLAPRAKTGLVRVIPTSDVDNRREGSGRAPDQLLSGALPSCLFAEAGKDTTQGGPRNEEDLFRARRSRHCRSRQRRRPQEHLSLQGSVTSTDSLANRTAASSRSVRK